MSKELEENSLGKRYEDIKTIMLRNGISEYQIYQNGLFTKIYINLTTGQLLKPQYQDMLYEVHTLKGYCADFISIDSFQRVEGELIYGDSFTVLGQKKEGATINKRTRKTFLEYIIDIFRNRND